MSILVLNAIVLIKGTSSPQHRTVLDLKPYRNALFDSRSLFKKIHNGFLLQFMVACFTWPQFQRLLLGLFILVAGEDSVLWFLICYSLHSVMSEICFAKEKYWSTR